MKIAVIFIILSLNACTSEKPSNEALKEAAGGQKAGSETQAAGTGSCRIEITPTDPTRKSLLVLRTSGCDLTAAGVEWKVNGKTAEAQKGYTFSAAETGKGDTIQASAMTRTGEVLSNTVVTRNLPPEIVDAYVKPGTAGVSAEAEARDADNDPIALSYEWTKNGKPAGNGKSLETTFAKGEKVSVKITPFDGEAYGKPVVLNSEINNAPLVITQDKEFNFDGRRWTYQIKASGGDTLTYALNSAPPGMTINPNTGLIAWNVPDGFSGQTAFTVTVSDGHGGEASYTAKINIK